MTLDLNDYPNKRSNMLCGAWFWASPQHTKGHCEVHETSELEVTKLVCRTLKEWLQGFEEETNARKYVSIASTSRATTIRDLQDLVKRELLSLLGEGVVYDTKSNLDKNAKSSNTR